MNTVQVMSWSKDFMIVTSHTRLQPLNKCHREYLSGLLLSSSNSVSRVDGMLTITKICVSFQGIN